MIFIFAASKNTNIKLELFKMTFDFGFIIFVNSLDFLKFLHNYSVKTSVPGAVCVLLVHNEYQIKVSY